MTKKDLDFLKQEMKNDYLLNDYLAIVQKDNHSIKIMFNFKVITIFEMSGFAYLISWYCDGSITASDAKHLNDICSKYNDRF